MMNKRRSFIIGIKSTSLSTREKKFIIKYKPWGIILFSRNIKSILQTKKLTDEIKKIFNDKKYPILIDQEGGNINRLKKFENYYRIFTSRTSYLLKSIGANINTVPVLDVRAKGSSNVIGDRSFSSDSKIVSKIGDICIKNFHQNNIATVIKHIPGHGLAKVDSHKLTPVVKTQYNQLIKNHFSAFKNKKCLLAMTAHIIYDDLDPLYTATHSKKIIHLIRNNIKFKNILMSDDISMKSLKYKIKQNTSMAFAAGCNLVLHCNADYKEMLVVAENSPLLSKFVIKKTSQLYRILS